MEEITWSVSGSGPAPEKKLPYVGTWKIFSRLPEEEKERIFNELRGVVLFRELMEKEGKK